MQTNTYIHKPSIHSKIPSSYRPNCLILLGLGKLLKKCKTLLLKIKLLLIFSLYINQSTNYTEPYIIYLYSISQHKKEN